MGTLLLGFMVWLILESSILLGSQRTWLSTNIMEILKVMSFFSRIIEEEDNNFLFHETAKDEFLSYDFLLEREKHEYETTKEK